MSEYDYSEYKVRGNTWKGAKYAVRTANGSIDEVARVICATSNIVVLKGRVGSWMQDCCRPITIEEMTNDQKRSLIRTKITDNKYLSVEHSAVMNEKNGPSRRNAEYKLAELEGLTDSQINTLVTEKLICLTLTESQMRYLLEREQ